VTCAGATLPVMQSGSRGGDSDHTRLAELAGRQHGVISTAQLRALDYSKHRIHSFMVRGHLHQVHRGVYAVGHTNLAIRGRWMAAVLACGPGALLSHRDAAALHDLQRIGSGPIQVSAPSRHALLGIRSHIVRDPHPEDRVVIDAIPVTSVSATFLSLAEIEAPRTLRSALEQGQRQGKLDFRALEAVIARNPGRHGIKPLTQAMRELVDEPPWTQSDLEDAFLELVRTAGLPPPQTNVYVEGELVDVVWREHNLVVQVDGWRFHQSRGSFEDDRRRDAKLVVRGWRVIRLTDRRVRDDRDAVAWELSELLLPAAPWRRRGKSDR
jgi:very-short-patch-repair endonuclease